MKKKIIIWNIYLFIIKFIKIKYEKIFNEKLKIYDKVIENTNNNLKCNIIYNILKNIGNNFEYNIHEVFIRILNIRIYTW